MKQPSLLDTLDLPSRARDKAVLGLDVVLVEHFLPRLRADALLATLLTQVPWKTQSMWMFGRRVETPRLTCWMGDEDATYTYSGIQNVPVPWLADVAALRRDLEAHCGTSFNSVLLNLYRSGQDTMGWHQDDEKELGPQPTIASVSLGAGRTFRMRQVERVPGRENVDFPLSHGSLLVMKGDVQHTWQHCIPKQARVLQPRVNLTFRRVFPSR